MSEVRDMVCDTARVLFAKAAGVDFDQSWPLVAEAGFSGLLVAEEDGGFGGDWGDFYAVMRLVGTHALALPVGEDMLAAHLITNAGLSRPVGAFSVAAKTIGTLDGARFTGTMAPVPWGRHVDHVVGLTNGTLLVVEARHAEIVHASNPAGDPMDRLVLDSAPVIHGPITTDLWLLAALQRTAQIAGALDHILELSIVHANTRIQFGKPLARFQAVQQNLALLAIEAGAVNCAGRAAAGALTRDCDRDQAALEIASAKLRANMAVGVGTSIAHQVHGAIGFTQDFSLHRYTRRLIGWRSDYGNDLYWAQRLGKMAAGYDGAGLWDEITRRSDAI